MGSRLISEDSFWEGFGEKLCSFCFTFERGYEGYNVVVFLCIRVV